MSRCNQSTWSWSDRFWWNFLAFQEFDFGFSRLCRSSDSSLLLCSPAFWVPPMEHQVIGAPKSEQGTQQTSSLLNVSIPTLTHLPLDAAIPSISEHTQLMEQWETLLKTGLKMDRLSRPTRQLTNKIAHYIQHSRGGESIFQAQTTWKSQLRSCCFINVIRNAGVMGIIHLDDRGELLSVIVMNHFLQQVFPARVQPDWLVLPDLTGHNVLWELIVFCSAQ